MTRQHYTEFNVGDRVRVSNGTKRPPDRHCRKLAEWQNRNYTGTVMEIEEPYTWPNGRVSNPDGGLVISDDRYPENGFIVIRHHMDLGKNLTVSKIEEEVAA